MRGSARAFSRLQSTQQPSPSGEGCSLKELLLIRLFQRASFAANISRHSSIADISLRKLDRVAQKQRAQPQQRPK
jgi:hypothetical protein